MELKGNFYTIQSIERKGAESYRAEVSLLADHPVYAGHFPGRPVVPGVCTLTIIRECLREIYGRLVRFTAIRECKYTSMLLPEPGLCVTLMLTVTDSGGLEGAVIADAGKRQVLKLRATIE